MTAEQALLLTDPEGSRMLVHRVDDIGYTIAVEQAGPGPFRLLEDADVQRLRSFFRPLVG